MVDMHKFLGFFLLLVAAVANGNGAPTILIFGDSLSAGYGLDTDQTWAALLQERLRSLGYEHQVVNASISGETSEGGITRIRTALERFEPELVILELGGNDGLRGFPPDRLQANLEAIIAAAQAAGAKVVLLGIRIPPNYGPRYTAAFEKAFEAAAAATDVPWIEFFMDGVASVPELMQDDGIHPNAAGQPKLLDNAWPIIEDSLPAPGGAG
jgi:acyl-CoA thioesterase I